MDLKWSIRSCMSERIALPAVEDGAIKIAEGEDPPWLSKSKTYVGIDEDRDIEREHERQEPPYGCGFTQSVGSRRRDVRVY